ncbi:uncharacterized protein F5891DRAFT_1208489 [Suillus fuscotomentosus]|uniref:EH domain-containing protein n=1 Tax=Suillus fuscotomentosus TaxID=1912939 RepID=A0AAD4ECP9_9AGAM|nr:uncharacterized protein F5891DRAFT_1208489 [Suillus fuscotomentosus]KAG1903834.1 hypothetical protein F5891DRAFT_1208489 [Suillus fuscotomentosus]
MPSAALQSRIKAFEALADQRPSQTTTKPSFVVLKAKYPPSSNTNNLLESPISPTSDSIPPIAPFTPSKSLSRSPSPSPPNLGRRTSLIDLKDWIVDDGPNGAPSGVSHYNGRHLKGFPDIRRTPPQVPHKPAAARLAPMSSAPLINLESPPKSRPPLPPRKPSYASTDSSPSISNSAISDSSATLRPPGHSDSLTVEHTYPPPRPHAFGSARASHAPASSISSFHSVSLSDGSDLKLMSSRLSVQSSLVTNGDNDGSVDGDIASIADSFENVSVTSAISPTTNVPFDWGKAASNGNGIPRPEPPKLPQRPGTKLPLSPPVSRSVSTSSSITPTTHRPRPPPPPPQSRTKLPSRTSPASTSASTSDRSSILSNATTASLTSISTTSISTRNSGHRRKAAKKAKLKSPPSSTLSVKKSRQAAGWRGLSVDLITNPEDHPSLPLKDAESENDDTHLVPVGPEERLGGRIVKLVWNASKLDRGKLRDIWNDCDPSSTGFLDREAFVKGMWRIDEELRRAQLTRRTSALSAASSQRIPHRPKNASNPRLLLQ